MTLDFIMAWRNIWRNPRRTVLTIAAIAFASMILVFMLSFQLGVYDTMINASVKIHAGHLQIQTQPYKDKMAMRYTISDPDKIGRLLQGIPEVTGYTYRAEGFSLVSSQNRTYGVLVTGIDPEKEKQVSTIAHLIRQGTYLSPKSTNEALIGKLLADNLKVGVGDELTILGQSRDGSIAATVVTVAGIFSSGIDDFDRQTVQVPLATFQAVYGMDAQVHRIIVMCRSLMDVGKVKARLQSSLKGIDNHYPLKVYDWMEIMPGLLESIQLDLVSGLIMYVILIIVVAFSILNTFLMAIFERTREFGVLMAIGTTPGRITQLLLIESISLTAIGIGLGMIIGSLTTLYFQNKGIDFTGASEIMKQLGISGLMYPRLSIWSLSIGPLAVFIITSLAALYPALKIRGLKPVEALS